MGRHKTRWGDRVIRRWGDEKDKPDTETPRHRDAEISDREIKRKTDWR
jgi:hypothetical protein